MFKENAMKLKVFFLAVLKGAALALIYAVCFIVPSLVFPITPEMARASAPMAGYELPLNLLFMVVVTVLLVKNSKWSGWKLTGVLWLTLWGLQTFMTQIETWYFIESFPLITPAEMLRLFIRNALTLLIFVPAAVWIAGGFKKKETAFRMPSIHLPGVLIALPLLGAAYLFLYLLAGYYIAWQFEATRAFYTPALGAVPGFFEQWGNTMKSHPSLLAFQVFRGMLWALLGYPLIASLKGKLPSRMALGYVLFGLVPTVQLIFPNPLMPSGVRFAHFIEVFLSTGTFGVLTVLAADWVKRPCKG